MKSLDQLMWLWGVYFHTAGTEEDILKEEVLGQEELTSIQIYRNNS